jgi:ferritin
MLLTPEVQEALNQQVRDELFAAHLYLSMAAWFDDQYLPGFSNWFRVQSAEESGHARRLFDFVSRRRGKPRLYEVPAPPFEWAAPADAVRLAFEHEQSVTAKIHAIHELAAQHADRATMVEIEWFITEQVEEEDAAETLLQRVNMAHGSAPALLILDAQLGQRQLGAEGAA